MSERTDIAIAGGGLTGLLAALALARADFSVTLIDAGGPADATAGRDPRTTALAAAPARVLKKLGVWAALEGKAGVMQEILVSQGRPQTRFAKCRVPEHLLHFDARNHGEDFEEPHGWVLENSDILTALDAAVAGEDNVRRVAARVTGYEAGEATAYLDLDTDEVVEATLVVAADGKFSPLRQQAGIRLIREDYGQKAVICNIVHDNPHGNCARQAFLPGGPFAILPLAGHRSGIVWSMPERKANAMLALDEAAFVDELAGLVSADLGAFELETPRAAYPLIYQMAERFDGPRLALAGDAGHVVHPLAGQGYNFAVKDIAALVDIVTEARGAGLDIGHGSRLEDYTKWRRADTVISGRGMDFMNRFFSADLPGLTPVRDFGLGFVNALSPVKDLLAREAAGTLGALPSLMRH